MINSIRNENKMGLMRSGVYLLELDIRRFNFITIILQMLAKYFKREVTCNLILESLNLKWKLYYSRIQKF